MTHTIDDSELSNFEQRVLTEIRKRRDAEVSEQQWHRAYCVPDIAPTERTGRSALQ